MSVKILIDSASDISLEEAKQLGISLAPIIVNFDDKEYYDGVTLLPKEFYKLLVKSENMPKTTQVNSFRFEEEYKKLLIDENDELIVITLSSKISGTYSSAMLAAKKFKNRVFVFDSLNATAGQRLLCLKAIELINNGYSAKQVFDELEKLKHKVVVYGVLDTLEYLRKGGRISSTVAFIGKVLLIKPVIQVVDGEINVIDKLKGTKRIKEYLHSKLIENDIDLEMPNAVMYTGFDDSKAQEFVSENEELKNNKNTNIYIIGSTIGTHIGPNVLGVAFFKK